MSPRGPLAALTALRGVLDRVVADLEHGYRLAEDAEFYEVAEPVRRLSHEVAELRDFTGEAIAEVTS